MTNLLRLQMYRAFKISCIVLIALIVEKMLFNALGPWLILTTFMLSLISMGAPVRQQLILFISIIFATLFAMLLNFMALPLLNALAVLLFFAVVFYVNQTAQTSFNKIGLFVFFSMLLFASFPLNAFDGHERFLQIATGAILALLGSLILFRVNQAKQFANALQPVISTLKMNLLTLADFYQEQTDIHQLNMNKVHLQNMITSRAYPEWVFESGFNPGLRLSLRYFLIQLDRLIDIVISAQQLAITNDDLTIHTALSDAIAIALHKDMRILEVIDVYVQTKKLNDMHEDLTQDILDLEKTLQQFVPPDLALLDASNHYLVLTSMVKDQREMRDALVELLNVLPAE